MYGLELGSRVERTGGGAPHCIPYPGGLPRTACYNSNTVVIAFDTRFYDHVSAIRLPFLRAFHSRLSFSFRRRPYISLLSSAIDITVVWFTSIKSLSKVRTTEEDSY